MIRSFIYGMEHDKRREKLLFKIKIIHKVKKSEKWTYQKIKVNNKYDKIINNIISKK